MSELIREVNFYKWHKNGQLLAKLPCANAWLEVTRKDTLVLCAHQRSPAWTRKNHTCQLDRCGPSLEISEGCGRDILALPPTAEYYGDLVSYIRLASSLGDLV